MPPADNQISESSDSEVKSEDLPVAEGLYLQSEAVELLEQSIEHPKPSAETETTNEPTLEDLEQSTGPSFNYYSVLK